METIKMIDLGLPSGTLWADRNVGAISPSDTGLYFEWGGIQGYAPKQIDINSLKYDFIYYRFSGTSANDSSNPQLTKYCNDKNLGKDGFIDNKLILDLEDDAAHINMGGDWRMPTHEDFVELIRYTDICLVLSDGTEIESGPADNDGYIHSWKWSLNDLRFNFQNIKIQGIKCINKKYNSNYIFIPASGSASLESVSTVGRLGFLWSKTINKNKCYTAHRMGFSIFYAGANYSTYRYSRLPIRGIIKKSNKKYKFNG